MADHRRDRSVGDRPDRCPALPGRSQRLRRDLLRVRVPAGPWRWPTRSDPAAAGRNRRSRSRIASSPSSVPPPSPPSSGGTITSSGSVAVIATDETAIMADAGAIAIALVKAQGGTTQTTFGVAFAINQITSVFVPLGITVPRSPPSTTSRSWPLPRPPSLGARPLPAHSAAGLPPPVPAAPPSRRPVRAPVAWKHHRRNHRHRHRFRVDRGWSGPVAATDWIEDHGDAVVFAISASVSKSSTLASIAIGLSVAGEHHHQHRAGQGRSTPS